MDKFTLDLDNSVDDDFFGALKGKSSKLQQLFVDDALSPDDKQQSLKYQRPKDAALPPNATRTTLMAKVVTAYCQGEPQGKVCLALIQNLDNTCSIIMYKTKTHILATLVLQVGRDMLYKQTKYWQFYDECSTYWSFYFDDLISETEFMDKLYVKGITFKKGIEKEQKAENHIASSKLNYETEGVCTENLNGDTKESKNSLIERMAKMGKSLPALSSSKQQTTADFSDSSDTEVIRTSLASSQKTLTASRNNKLNCSRTNQLLTTGSTIYPINPLECQYMQMLLTEQRTQGSEIRININKLENKIEKVLDKLEIKSECDGKQKSEKEDELLELEEKLLLLKKENRKLKLQLNENSSKLCEGNTVEDLLYEFKDDLDHFNIDYKQDLKDILFELHSTLKESHAKLKESQKKGDEVQLKLDKINAEAELKVQQNIALENEIISLKQQELELKNKAILMETEIKRRKEELFDLQKKLQDKNKYIMNNTYVDLADKLTKMNVPQCQQILSVIASSIKQTLLSLTQNVQTDN